MSRESYMHLLQRSDRRIAALLDQGFALSRMRFGRGRPRPALPSRIANKWRPGSAARAGRWRWRRRMTRAARPCPKWPPCGADALPDGCGGGPRMAG